MEAAHRGRADGPRPARRRTCRARRPSRRAGQRPARRPGQPVHRHPERGQHLPGRRRAFRHGAALAGHRAQHRLRLHAEPHPRLLPRASLRRGLPDRRRPAGAADDGGRDRDGLREVRGRIQPRQRAGEPGLLPGGPRQRHRRRVDGNRADGGAALHLSGHRQGERPAERRPGAAQDRLHRRRGPGRPDRADQDQWQRLLPGHRPVHGLHDHPVRPAVHRVRNVARGHGHRGLGGIGRRHRAQRCLRPVRRDRGPHGRGDHRAVVRGRAGRRGQPPLG